MYAAHTLAQKHRLDADLRAWLDTHADALDAGGGVATEVPCRLAGAGFLRLGVPTSEGGDGGDVGDALSALASVAECSLVAAFVLWSQRSYIEYLVRSDNAALRAEQLPALLDGRLAGVSGLSNAIKHLAGLEPLAILASGSGDDFYLDGRVPWITNARPEGFSVAVPVRWPDGRATAVALRHDDPGVRRGPDLELMALRGSYTATLVLEGVRVAPERIIHPDLPEWLPAVRPTLIGLQAGLAIGLARRSLAEAQRFAQGREQLIEPVTTIADRLDDIVAELAAGLRDKRYVAAPGRLFALRIELAGIVRDAVDLELKAKGGSAYLVGSDGGFARRWREAAFIPIVTPSVVQLGAIIARDQAAA